MHFSRVLQHSSSEIISAIHITCDFTKDFESKTNIKFQITNFSMKEIRSKVIGGWLGLFASNKTPLQYFFRYSSYT